MPFGQCPQSMSQAIFRPVSVVVEAIVSAGADPRLDDGTAALGDAFFAADVPRNESSGGSP